jgi:hypothetical protein
LDLCLKELPMPLGTNAPVRVTEIVVLLRPSPPRKLPESLTGAASIGDIARVQLFLDRGANIEERAFFASPLAAACSVGQLDAVR